MRTKKISIGMWYSGLLCLGFFMLSSFGYAADGGDCGLSLTPEKFKDRVNEIFEEEKAPQIFFTDNQLESVQKSLDTYCCRTNKTPEDECGKKKLYPSSKNVVYSPYYLDHFLSLYRLYLRGDTVVCDTYGFDCFTRIDEKNGYPGKPLCLRYGEEADGRCKSLYDVGSGVDTMGASTDISSPSDYRALYEKFWVDTNNILIPKPEEAKDMSPEELTLMHMGRYMCNEVEFIYSNVLQIDTNRDQSMNPIAGSTLQKCQTSAMMNYKSHAFDYINTLSLAKGTDQLIQINKTSREHILDVLDDMKKTMSTVRTKMTNVLRRFPEFTNTCSV